MKKIITKRLVDTFVKVWKERTGEKPHDINSGWCYQFALVLYAIHGDKVKLCSTDQHVWVEFNGKHYDSDHRHGVCKPLDKGFELGGHWYTSKEEIERYWGNPYKGISGRVRWDIINEVVATGVPKKQVVRKDNRKVNFRLKRRAHAKV